MKSSDRRQYMLLSLTTELYVSAAVILVGAGACYEIITQSLQPVLGTLELRSPSDSESQSAASHRTASSTLRRPASAIVRLKMAPLSFFNRVKRAQKAEEGQHKRTSLTFFETSSNVRQRQSVRLHDSPEAEGGLHATRDDGVDSNVSDSVDARSTDVQEKLPKVHQLHESGNLTSRYGADMSRDSERTAWSQSPSYGEVPQLRIFPPPGHQTRVRFTQEMQLNYEEPGGLSPRPASKTVKPDWRYPAGYVPRLP